MNATALQVELLRTIKNTSQDQDLVMQAPENSGRGVAMAAAALRSVDDDTSNTQVGEVGTIRYDTDEV